MSSDGDSSSLPSQDLFEQQVQPAGVAPTSMLQQSTKSRPKSNPVASGLTPKEIVERKREAKRLEEIENLTFQPTLNKKTLQNVEGTLLGRLQADIEKRKEPSKVDEEDLTFTPKFFTSKTRPVSAPRVERVKAVEVPAAPTFQPTITKRASSSKRTGPIGDRLYAAGLETKVKTDLLKLVSQQNELQDCTFAPKINNLPGEPTSARAPLVERMKQYTDEVENRKREKKSQVDRERLAEATFSPSIKVSKDRNANNVATHSRDDIFTRLSTTTTRASAAEPPKPAAMQAVSKPKASTGSSVPIYERLVLTAAAKRAEFDAEAQRMIQERDKELTFAPQLSSNPEIKVHNSEKDVVRRLSTIHKSVEELEKIRAEIETRDCTFKPNISASEHIHTSNMATSKEPVHIRLMLEAEAKKQKALELEKQKIAGEMRGATFAPQLPTESAAKVEYTGDLKNVVRRLSTTTTGKSAEMPQKMKKELECKDIMFNPNAPAVPSTVAPKVHRSAQTKVDGVSASTDKLGSVFGRIEADARLVASLDEGKTTSSGAKFSTKPLNLVTSSAEVKVVDSTASKPIGAATKSAIQKKSHIVVPEQIIEPKVRVSVVPKSTPAQPKIVIPPKNSLPSAVDRKTFDSFTKELKSMTSFPLSIKLFAEAVVCFIDSVPALDEKESIEQTIRKLISPGDLYDKLCGVEMLSIVVNRMKKFRDNSMFTPAILSRSSKIAGDICSWMLREIDLIPVSSSIPNSPSKVSTTDNSTPPRISAVNKERSSSIVKEQIARIELISGSASKAPSSENYMYCPFEPAGEDDHAT